MGALFVFLYEACGNLEDQLPNFSSFECLCFCLLAMWVSALLEDGGQVWHHVTLEGTCKPAWMCSFVPMCFAHHPGRNPNSPQAGLGSLNRVHLILLRGKKITKPKYLPGESFQNKSWALAHHAATGKLLEVFLQLI